MPTVSVVVPAYNAEGTIAPLLESLLGIDYPDFEIIVVDDGSTDSTKAIAARYPLRLIERPHRGASAARDAGLRASQEDIVAYVDSDVTVTRDWLTKLVQPFASPGIAATTGRTIFRRSDKCTSWVRSLDIERRNAGRRTFTRLANGPNSAFRRSVLLEVGGFDPSWYHAEDTEVSYRICQRGYVIQYVPDSIVYHVPEEDWRKFLRKRYRDARAFTRMLATYPRTAILEDDFVTFGMKVQPPIYLAALLLGILAAVSTATSFALPVILALAGVLAVALLLNVPESVAIAQASGRVSFFFKGLVLGTLRGFVWAAGLGIGGLRQTLTKAAA